VQTSKLKLSGADFVQRLEHLGFTVGRSGYGMTLLKRAEKRVMVPDVETIEPEMMEAILRSAGLSEAEFFGRSRSGIYPRQSATGTGVGAGTARARESGDGER
jgi:predicted RNA binding protein YcfA (HicA-like mRNA interferase family)